MKFIILICLIIQAILAKYWKAGAKWKSPGEVPQVPPKDASMIRLSIAGDSLTDIGPGSWPIHFSELIKDKKYAGKEIEVGNFGRSGSTCSEAFETNKDYQQFMVTENYKEMMTSAPDYVVVMLGSNDAKKPTWDKTGVEKFKENYPKYLKAFQDLPSKPKVFAAVPPAVLPCFDPSKDKNTFLNVDVVNEVLPKLIPELVKGVEGVELIDIRKFMGGDDKAKQQEWCQKEEDGKKTEGFHYGNKMIAEGFLEALAPAFEKFGGKPAKKELKSESKEDKKEEKNEVKKIDEDSESTKEKKTEKKIEKKIAKVESKKEEEVLSSKDEQKEETKQPIEEPIKVSHKILKVSKKGTETTVVIDGSRKGNSTYPTMSSDLGDLISELTKTKEKLDKHHTPVSLAKTIKEGLWSQVINTQ